MSNLSQNVKMHNKYRFKDGVKGLVKMSELSTKLGVSMEFASGFADKLWDVEGAVETSAQLQVMGGAFARLADPFKLMYMARNDMAGLTDAVINATKATAAFNAKTGEFDISALEMSRLRKVAEATGLNFEELAKSAKNAAKFTAIRKQISYGFDENTKKFIESTSTLDEKGRAKIMVGTEEKYLNTLTQIDKNKIKEIAAEKANMEKRAKDSQGLDDLLKNTITMFRQLLIPLVETINNRLRPKLDELITKFKDPKFLDGIIKLAKGIGDFIAGIGEFVIKWPKLTAGLILGIAGIKWFLNGVTLGLGFNSVAGKGMGGVGGGSGAAGMFGVKPGAGFGANFTAARASGFLKLGGVIAGLTTAITDYNQNVDKGMGRGEAAGRATLKGTGAGLGAWGGAAAGAAIGSVVPVVGTAIGALIGGALGAWGGGALGEGAGNLLLGQPKTMNDGVIFNPKDKFIKMNDGLIAGTNINGNKELAKAIMSASAPGFNDRDYLINQSKANASSNTVSNANVNFDDLKVNGTINLKLNNEESSRTIGKDLMSDPIFLRSLSLKVNEATARAMNGKI
jgi:hypothetical protein